MIDKRSGATVFMFMQSIRDRAGTHGMSFVARHRQIPGFLCVLFLAVCPGLAASTLDFPRLSFDSGTITGIAVLNPNDTAAELTLTAYGANGQQLLEPVQVTIQPGRQFSDLTSSLFGSGFDPGTVGWFRAFSPSDDLTGFFLYLNLPEISLFDGADLPQASQRIVFNEVRLEEGFTTELNLINPGEVEASVTVQLVGADTTRSKSVTLPARGALRADAGEFFQSEGPAGAAPGGARYVVAEADVEIAGFAFVKEGAGDLLGVNARPADELLNALFFPQLAVLDPFRTRLRLVNYSDETALATVTAFRPDGTLFGNEDLQNNPVTLGLEAGQIADLDLETLFGFAGDRTLEGWVRVDATPQAVNGSLSYELVTNGSIAAVAPVSSGATRAVFSHIATRLGFFTGVAVLNGSSLAASVRVVAVSAEGEVLGSFSTVLPPGQRISQLIDELIPQAADQAGGFIFITSDVPVYLTSLFGSLTSGVLANIPPQPVPEGFRPDAGSPRLRVTPSLAVLGLDRTQTFEAAGVAGPVQWSVGGVLGGNAQVGSIDDGGRYTAPASIPMPLPVTVSATAAEETAGASVDVLSPEQLVGGLGVVQSLAYLKGLQRLYTAELTVSDSTGTSSGVEPAQVEASSILDVTGPSPQSVAVLAGEEVSKMVPYLGANGREYLLLAARTSGRILRLDPESREVTEIATGLNAPTALLLEPATGDLLVAEEDGISRVAASRLQIGPEAALRQVGQPRPTAAWGVLAEEGAAGLAVDRCTEDLYYTTGDRLQVLRRGAAEAVTLATDLDGAGPLLALQRRGVSCPDSFHLLIAETAADRILLYRADDDAPQNWAEASDVRDLIFLPLDNPFPFQQSVALNQNLGAAAEILLVEVPALYGTDPVNPPALPPPPCEVEFEDANLAAAVREALQIGPTEPVTCESAQSLTFLRASFRGVESLKGIERLTQLSSLELYGSSGSSLSDLGPLADLSHLERLLLSNNAISDLGPLAGLTQLSVLLLSANSISDLGPLAGLTQLEDLRLDHNDISDLDSLAGLNQLRFLLLNSNSISSLGALVQNQGLGAGDEIRIRSNPLDSGDCQDIQTLVDRGATVVHDLECP